MEDLIKRMTPKYDVLDGATFDKPISSGEFKALSKLLSLATDEKYRSDAYLATDFWTDVNFSTHKIKAESYMNLYSADLGWCLDDILASGIPILDQHGNGDIEKNWDRAQGVVYRYVEGRTTYSRACYELQHLDTVPDFDPECPDSGADSDSS
jgi:hypothetical protein